MSATPGQKKIPIHVQVVFPLSYLCYLFCFCVFLTISYVSVSSSLIRVHNTEFTSKVERLSMMMVLLTLTSSLRKESSSRLAQILLSLEDVELLKLEDNMSSQEELIHIPISTLLSCLLELLMTSTMVHEQH